MRSPGAAGDHEANVFLGRPDHAAQVVDLEAQFVIRPRDFNGQFRSRTPEACQVPGEVQDLVAEGDEDLEHAVAIQEPPVQSRYHGFLGWRDDPVDRNDAVHRVDP
jgi:hypothetical protein